MKLIKALQNSKTLISLLIILSLWSCERDDICAATTATTPHLIIRFYNIDAITETKTVRRMNVTAEGNPKFIVNDKTTDSIILPLRVDALDILNTSRFVLTRDQDYATDSIASTVSNADIIEIKYTPELIYVSRACGYKSVFNDISARRETDSTNWIINIEVIKDTINNENAAHINIYH
ncbi:DUF6452 family protein [Gelidibacter pelagius]|uniref:DUF1735 domain-containing protein n=1 Tax=Gelidibacter pelagius TaxID=2819985 RepID=A0ABS3SPT8_9FLAO|nr:DUF6452 family protein [Gelidibacter pelagius]MBO3097725.1 hypothetical protein [Gelidibacter pelagius]